MAIKTVPFQPEKYFESQTAQQRLVAEALNSNNPGFLRDAIGTVLRARGVGDVAKSTGLSRQALYAAFGPKGNPTMATVVKLLTALGLTLQLKLAA